MRYPNTLDKNVYIAYFNKNQKNDSSDLNWDLSYPETLKEITIKTIAENWHKNPIFNEILCQEDKFFLIDILDCNIPLQKCINIEEDSFWRKIFIEKYKNFYTNSTKGKRWIYIYLEHHLSDFLQNLKPSDGHNENLKQLIEICNQFVKKIKLNCLEPSLTESDHIPFDIILSNLTELRVLDFTYDCKTIGTKFYLGCSTLTNNDVKRLVRGLERCYELRELKLHSSKLEPNTLKLMAIALDKGCRNLTTLDLHHCRFGDAGLHAFLDCMGHESLPKLENIILTNNFISEGVVRLTQLLRRRQIKNIDLRLNPISSNGAAAVLGIVNYIELEMLNLSSCSFDDSIGSLLEYVIKVNRTLKFIDISNNKLGIEFGLNVLKSLQENRYIQHFDIRNCEILQKTKWEIDLIILGNKISGNS